MQELRSTDILDKEIQADARKKVERMLKDADRQCEQLLASIDSEIEKAADDKRRFFNKKLEAFENDKKASVPLEKERFAVSFVQNAITQNINQYLESLSEEKQLELVSKNFDFKSCPKVNASVYGFSLEKAKKFLSGELGDKLISCKEIAFGTQILEDDLGLSKPCGIILESEDKNIRSRLTFSEVLSRLLDKHRAELSETLFGEKMAGGEK